jgi:hypothetical protein
MTKEWNVGGEMMRIPESLSESSSVPPEYQERLRKLCEQHEPPSEWFVGQAKFNGVEKFRDLTLIEFLRLAVSIKRHYWLSGNDIDLSSDAEIPDYSQPATV